MKKIKPKYQFPPLESANEDGLLAIGGDLDPERLIMAYRSGIFPWYDSESPILWWSPDPRFVLFPQNIKISKSMKSILKQNKFQITYNQCFGSVIRACSAIKRKEQDNTWIINDMIIAYEKLHVQQIAISVEIWHENNLVGGLYGIKMGNCFFGESMFSKISNASKVALISLIKDHPEIKLIDCQVYTSHLESLGAEMISRNEFINLINENID